MKKNIIKRIIIALAVAAWLLGWFHQETPEEKRLNDWVVYCQFNGIEPTETPTAEQVRVFNNYYINK